MRLQMEYVIKPKSDLSLGLEELWEFRELFFFFTWRDVKIKYKQAVLGIFWAILQPLFMTVIFSTLLGKAINDQTHLPIPYPVFVLSGLLLWGIFSGGMTNAADSMIANANIIKKIYFPRLVIPLSAVLAACVDFLMALAIFFAMIVWYQVPVSGAGIWVIPLAVLQASVAAAGVGIFFAALNVKYRDFRYIIPFLMQSLMFLTPVVYPVSIADNGVVQKLLQLNPMAGALELFRGVFRDYIINWETVGASALSCAVFFTVGIFYFRKAETHFADIA